MRNISSNAELEHLHFQAQGFVYNDYSGISRNGVAGNVLHASRCRHVGSSGTKYAKYFFENEQEAIMWLTKYRGPEGRNWRRCRLCSRPHLANPRC